MPAANVMVAVRVRPMTQKEVDRGAFSCLEVQDGWKIDVTDPDDKMGGLDYLRADKTKDRTYAFDTALDPQVSQEDAYMSTLRDLLPDVLQGRNVCCFAYGATGSGKTFTMTGNSQMPGIIPNTVDSLFESTDADTAVQMQYVEIYNEQIKDLLQPSNGNLDVREAPGRGTFVAGAANVEVRSRDEVEELLLEGNAFRTTESTKMNSVSSRSHAVLQVVMPPSLPLSLSPLPLMRSPPSSPLSSHLASILSLVQLRVETSGQASGHKGGKLSLIDLAGSERANKTGVVMAGGRATKRLNEGANINRSLLALANCINALASDRGGHVPYRDSKLTRLLKDSLGGNCRTMMIANVSPGMPPPRGCSEPPSPRRPHRPPARVLTRPTRVFGRRSVRPIRRDAEHAQVRRPRQGDQDQGQRAKGAPAARVARAGGGQRRGGGARAAEATAGDNPPLLSILLSPLSRASSHLLTCCRTRSARRRTSRLSRRRRRSGICSG